MNRTLGMLRAMVLVCSVGLVSVSFGATRTWDGATGYNSSIDTGAVQVPSSTGAGLSYSTTLNLAGLGAGLSKVSDYDYIAIGFQKVSSAPDLAIDKVIIKALVPSGTVVSIR